MQGDRESRSTSRKHGHEHEHEHETASKSSSSISRSSDKKRERERSAARSEGHHDRLRREDPSKRSRKRSSTKVEDNGAGSRVEQVTPNPNPHPVHDEVACEMHAPTTRLTPSCGRSQPSINDTRTLSDTPTPYAKAFPSPWESESTTAQRMPPTLEVTFPPVSGSGFDSTRPISNPTASYDRFRDPRLDLGAVSKTIGRIRTVTANSTQQRQRLPPTPISPIEDSPETGTETDPTAQLICHESRAHAGETPTQGAESERLSTPNRVQQISSPTRHHLASRLAPEIDFTCEAQSRPSTTTRIGSVGLAPPLSPDVKTDGEMIIEPKKVNDGYWEHGPDLGDTGAYLSSERGSKSIDGVHPALLMKPPAPADQDRDGDYHGDSALRKGLKPPDVTIGTPPLCGVRSSLSVQSAKTALGLTSPLPINPSAKVNDMIPLSNPRLYTSVIDVVDFVDPGVRNKMPTFSDGLDPATPTTYPPKPRINTAPFPQDARLSTELSSKPDLPLSHDGATHPTGQAPLPALVWELELQSELLVLVSPKAPLILLQPPLPSPFQFLNPTQNPPQPHHHSLRFHTTSSRLCTGPSAQIPRPVILWHPNHFRCTQVAA